MVSVEVIGGLFVSDSVDVSCMVVAAAVWVVLVVDVSYEATLLTVVFTSVLVCDSVWISEVVDNTGVVVEDILTSFVERSAAFTAIFALTVALPIPTNQDPRLGGVCVIMYFRVTSIVVGA